MDIRKLIKEEVERTMTCDHDPNAMRRSIPFEHDVQMLRDTQHRSAFHLGGKVINAKEMALHEKPLGVIPVKNVPFEKKRETTEREKDFNRFFLDRKFGADGEFVKSVVMEAPRMDALMHGVVMHNFNVKAMFEDMNGDVVFKVSLKDKNVDDDRRKHEEYIPGGLASRKTLKDIAIHHDVPLETLFKQLKKGVKVEMEHTTDELIAIEIAKDHLMEDPVYYDKLEVIEKPQFENSMGVSAYSMPNASLFEKRMERILEEVNKVFGTYYFVKTMYPERFEQVYVITSGKLRPDGSRVGDTKMMNFTEEENKRHIITRGINAINGVDDGTPWRSMTEPLDVQPYRSAVVGTSHRNA